MGDQRGHLQALRHLYVLAAQPRLLRAVDAITGAPVYAPLTVRRTDAGEEAFTAPGLAPEAGLVAQLRVLGPRHWAASLEGAPAAVALAAGVVAVQRRPGCMAYEDDPSGSRSLLASAGPLADAAVPLPRDADAAPPPVLHAGSRASELAETAAADAKAHRAMTHACRAAGTDDAAPVLAAIHAVTAQLRAGCLADAAGVPLALRLATLRLALAFYDGALRKRTLGPAPPLLPRVFLDTCALAAHALEGRAVEGLPAFLATGVGSPGLGAWLTHEGVPPRETLLHGMGAALAAAAETPDAAIPPPLRRLLAG